MKKLPVGIQSIEKIIEQDYVYVDKTDIIHQLITDGQYYFLSRPRRFGKSLLLSTLEAIFRGNRELFKGCLINDLEYDWKEHPIIYFDFARIPTDSPEELASALQRTLHSIASSYNTSIDCPTLQEGLANLVTELAKRGPVVVLIDEYDKPLLDNIEQLDVAKRNQHVLKNFYGTLKALDKQLRFVFATGVTKFAKISLFSGFNNLTDITTDPAYATLLGYTPLDLRLSLGDRIKKVAEQKCSGGLAAASEEAVFAEMKEWYNGYRFSKAPELVYNPYSTMSFLRTGMVRNYWFETGTPTLLVQKIRECPGSVMEFGEMVADQGSPLDVSNLARLKLTPLMWQTGYLTIQNYDEASRRYKLDFPNREVREAFFQTLVEEFAELKVPEVDRFAAQCHRQLAQYEFLPFIKTMRSLFATIPNTLARQESEASYHVVFLVILEAMGIKVQAEVQTNVGRIDLVIERENCIYIIEFKFDKDAATALKQIELKNYKQKYDMGEKDVVLMGINFSSKDRNIADCRAIVHRRDGSRSEEIDIPATSAS